jgi:hypothetical protein
MFSKKIIFFMLSIILTFPNIILDNTYEYVQNKKE